MDLSNRELAKLKGETKYQGSRCRKCLKSGVVSTLRYVRQDNCVTCTKAKNLATKHLSRFSPLGDDLVIDDPYRDLIASVLLFAIEDSKNKLKEVSHNARVWIKHNIMCKYYCVLLGISYDYMVEQVSRRW